MLFLIQIEDLAENGREWTTVDSSLHFETVDHFQEFCQILEPYVQKLNLLETFFSINETELNWQQVKI